MQDSLTYGQVCLWTGLPDLDAALRRGIPMGAVTEIVGPASVGKSQMCHMLAWLMAAPSPHGLQVSGGATQAFRW